MKAKIKDKREVAEGTLMVSFDLLGGQLEFKAGQYFFITLPDLKYPDERGARRHFSIVNSPNEKGVLTMTTRITESGFKKTLKELPIGTEVEVGPIAGAFGLPQNLDRPLVFIAGGIGITPFMSILKFVKEENIPVSITLIYSNRSKSSSAYLEEVKELADQIPNFRLVLTMTEDETWDGEKRKVDADFIKEYTNSLQNPLFMVVGPPPMIEAIVLELKKLNIEDDNIRFEKFTGY